MSQRRRQNAKTVPRSAPSAGTARVKAAPLVSWKEKLVWAGILLGIYGYAGTWGQFDFSDLMGYYSMQADAVLQGHLYVAPTPDQALMLDMIPFEGHYYLQWGPVPALLHLTPKLVGINLSDRVACILAGCLISLVFLEIMLLLWTRYYLALPKWVCRWFFFAFALGTPTAIVALRGTIYHESIAWAALFVLAAFLAFLRYAIEPSTRWALAAGLGLALATATRVTQLLYAPGLFAGIAWVLYAGKQRLRMAATHLAWFSAPVVASVLLMLAYNQARFHSPWEYGLKYIPTVDAQKPPYKLNRVAENFEHYVLAPIRLRRDVPWLEHTGWQPLVNTGRAEDMSSMFLASPFLLLGALAWRVFRERGAAVPKIFSAVAGASGAVVFFSLLMFSGASRRYMQDFLPEFMILAFLGVAAHAGAGVNWRPWQKPAWGVVFVSAVVHAHLVFFEPSKWAPLDPNIMKTYVLWSPAIRRALPGHNLDSQEAISHNELGIRYLHEGRYAQAIPHFERAQQLLPQRGEIDVNLKVARAMEAAAESRHRR